jgi:hypothetical protein
MGKPLARLPCVGRGAGLKASYGSAVDHAAVLAEPCRSHRGLGGYGLSESADWDRLNAASVECCSWRAGAGNQSERAGKKASRGVLRLLRLSRVRDGAPRDGRAGPG